MGWYGVIASVHLLHVSENVSPAFGIFYNPQINIINKYADFSLAATLPVTLGAHVKDSWIEETFFYAHVPAVHVDSQGSKGSKQGFNASFRRALTRLYEFGNWAASVRRQSSSRPQHPSRYHQGCTWG